MAIKTRKCLSCSTSYQFCPDCNGADRLAPAWKSEFCCENCKTLWQTATKFNIGKLTKAEAKEIISALNLKPAEQYVDCIQRDLKNIMVEEPKPRIKRGKKTAMPIVEEAIAPVIKTEIKLPEPVVEPVVTEEVAPVVEPTTVEEIAPVAEVHEVVDQTEEK